MEFVKTGAVCNSRVWSICFKFVRQGLSVTLRLITIKVLLVLGRAGTAILSSNSDPIRVSLVLGRAGTAILSDHADPVRLELVERKRRPSTSSFKTDQSPVTCTRTRSLTGRGRGREVIPEE